MTAASEEAGFSIDRSPSGTPPFWMVARAWALVWFAFLLAVGILGRNGADDVYYASLFMGASALFVALLGEGGGANRGLTIPKLFALITSASSTVVDGSLLLSGTGDPEFRAIQRGAPLILMGAVAAAYFASVAVGLRLTAPTSEGVLQRAPLPLGRLVDGRLAWCAVVVGGIAMAVRFPNPSVLVSYWLGDVKSPESSGLLALFSALMRPFLAVGIAMLLVRWATGSRSRSAIAAAGMALVALLVLGTYGLNRAALAAPLVAALLLRSDDRRRTRWGLAGITGAATLWLLFLWGQYRRLALLPAAVRSAMPDSGGPGFAETLQVYGQAPQFSAVIVGHSDSFPAVSLAAEILSPVPGVPEALRSVSGTKIYNALIYGAGGSEDQILATWAHLWAVGGVALVVLSGIVVGLLAGGLVRKKNKSSNVIMRYGLTLLAVWLLLSPYYSWLAVSQACFYFCTPLIVVGWASSMRLGPQSGVVGPARAPAARGVQGSVVRSDNQSGHG